MASTFHDTLENVRTFHVPIATTAEVPKIVRENVDRESRLHTDESRLYDDEHQHSRRIRL